WDLNIHLYEEVLASERNENLHKVRTRRGEYLAKVVVLALGFYDLPFLLNVPGEDLPKVKHYYDEPHPYFRQRVVVVGASNSAVDVALETWRKGADVTMVIKGDTIGDNVKYWVRPDIENRLKEGSIKSCCNSRVVEITPSAVVIDTPTGRKTLENDYVIAMTGYQPPFAFMRAMGIEFHDDEDHTPVYDEATMETNVPNLCLAGGVCGGLKTNKWFIENSRVHAEMIVRDVLRKFSLVKEGAA